MQPAVDVLTREPDPAPATGRSLPRWIGPALVVAGLAGGYLLGSTGDLADPATASDAERPDGAVSPPTTVVDPAVPGVEFPGTLVASTDFGDGLVVWDGGGDPVVVGLASGVETAALDAARDRMAVTVPGYGGGNGALLVGRLGDLRPVATGVTGFAWHPLEPGSMVWVAETAGGVHELVRATVTDRGVAPTVVAVLDRALRPTAWGPWGYALQGDDVLVVLDPSGTPVGEDDVQLVAAGPDGRLLVARPAGRPLSSDWAFTSPDLDDPVPLERFADLDEHPVAAAILPRSGRTLLVSNRFGDRWRTGRIEVLAPDGTSQGVLRLTFIAESVAWSPDEAMVAIGGYTYRPDRVRSRVAFVDAGLTGDPVEVPFDGQIRPLGLRP